MAGRKEYLKEFVETHQEKVKPERTGHGIEWKFSFSLFENPYSVAHFDIDSDGSPIVYVAEWAGKTVLQGTRGMEISEAVIFSMKAQEDMPESPLTPKLVEYTRDLLNELLELLPPEKK